MKKLNMKEFATPFGLFAILLSLVMFYRKWSTATKKEGFVSKKCPDGTRSDGPCLMEFPGL